MKKLVLIVLASCFAGSAAYAKSTSAEKQTVTGAVKAAVNGASEAEPCYNKF